MKHTKPMKPEKEFKFIIVFLCLFLVLTTIYTVLTGNTEFLLYASVMFFALIVILFYHKKLHLTNQILIGICILIIAHILGGNLHISGVRLYDMWFGPFKYDNIMHAFGSVLMTLIVYNFLAPMLNKSVKKNQIILTVTLMLVVFGIGAFNEMVEFLAVLCFNASAGVGDYFNNAIDLYYNALGAVVGAFIAMRHHFH